MIQCFYNQGETEVNSKDAPVKSIIGELGDGIYIPPPSLEVPPETAVPPTQKLAKIIEKTANFISSQGVQMEIIVKTKQANNPMFQFLHFDSPLHPFYRHVLTAIRNGTYTVPTDDESEANVKESVSEDSSKLGSPEEVTRESSVIPKESAPLRDVEPSTEILVQQLSSEVKTLIDKTASFMSKHSRELENAILAKEGIRDE